VRPGAGTNVPLAPKPKRLEVMHGSLSEYQMSSSDYFDREPTEADQLKLEFRQLDNRDEGMLNFEELKSLLQQGNSGVSVAVAKQLYDCMAKDRDGRISFDAFVDFIYSERTQTSQARLCCGTRMTRMMSPFCFPSPWSGLEDDNDEGDDALVHCSFEEFQVWLSQDQFDEGGEHTLAKLKGYVGQLQGMSNDGNRAGARAAFDLNVTSSTIDCGKEYAVAGETFLSSKAALCELQQGSGFIQWTGQARSEGVQCGEILQEALLAKLTLKGCLRITPRLVQALHQIVTCGKSLPPWRQDRAPPDVNSVSHRPPPASALPTLVVLFCMQTETALQKWDAHDAAALALWWIHNLHPFSDGTGRTSRGLALAVLYSRGYVASQHSFHEQFRMPGMRERLVACLEEANTAIGSCDCCRHGKSIGVKPRAFASLSSLLKELTPRCLKLVQ